MTRAIQIVKLVGVVTSLVAAGLVPGCPGSAGAAEPTTLPDSHQTEGEFSGTSDI